MKDTRFKDLLIGQTFDFIRPTGMTTFWWVCRKISPRRYRIIDTDKICHIGSINALVYHVR